MSLISESFLWCVGHPLYFKPWLFSEEALLLSIHASISQGYQLFKPYCIPLLR